MTRLTAFSLFVCAAFAWPLPWLDRAGTAALGFAFVALSVGRGLSVPRPSIFDRSGAQTAPPATDGDPMAEVLARLGMPAESQP